MSDAEHQPLELHPLPHPELFDLDLPAEESKPSKPAASKPEPAKPAPRPVAKPSGRPRWQRFMFAVAALLLYAVLIDGAAEAVLNETPLRWWATGAVAAFLILNVLLWKKTGWAMKAGTAALALLGLLTFSAWYSTDVSERLTFALQPAPVVFSAVTALLIALAGFSLMRIRALPWWDKAVIGLVAAYGVAAFVLPLILGIAYPDLLGPAGFWSPMPFWLQGDFVGALVLIPATILALLVVGALRVRGVKLWGWGFKVTAFALGLAMITAAFGGPFLF